MKITFEGNTFGEILNQITDVLAEHSTAPKSQAPKDYEYKSVAPAAPVVEAQGPGPEGPKAVEKPVDTSVNKPGRTPKQLENDERLRVRAQEKAAAKKAEKANKASVAEGNRQMRALKAEEEEIITKAPPPPKAAAALDPAEVVKIRQKTIEDLQSAYANGFQKEVFELLSRFGNGAKSFRELPPDAFVPIREAIDNGALT